MPVDEEELDRIDLKHRLYTILLDEQYFLAPIGPNPQQILDLGTGSGRSIPPHRNSSFYAEVSAFQEYGLWMLPTPIHLHL